MFNLDDFPTTSVALLQELVNQKSDSRAWQKIVDRYLPEIISWGRKRGLQKADAEDLAGDVLARLAIALPNLAYNPKLRFRGWLATALKWTMANTRRRQFRQPRCLGTGDSEVNKLLNELPDMVDDDLITTIDHMLTRDIKDVLMQKALLAVKESSNETTWQAFVRCADENATHADIAAELDMKPEAVRKAVSRFKQRVNAEFERLLQELEASDQASHEGQT